MKKVVFAVAASLFMISCGGSSEPVVSDSTVVEVVDSSAVDSSLTASDSTVAQIPGGSGDIEQPVK